MDTIDEYLIKIEDFPKLLTTLLKEKVVSKIIGAKVKVDKKTQKEDRFTIFTICYYLRGKLKITY